MQSMTSWNRAGIALLSAQHRPGRSGHPLTPRHEPAARLCGSGPPRLDTASRPAPRPRAPERKIVSCPDVKAWLPYSRLMSLRFTGWLAAGLAMLITLTLVVVELTDAGQRRWWAAHPLTTDTVAGGVGLRVSRLLAERRLTPGEARA